MIVFWGATISMYSYICSTKYTLCVVVKIQEWSTLYYSVSAHHVLLVVEDEIYLTSLWNFTPYHHLHGADQKRAF